LILVSICINYIDVMIHPYRRDKPRPLCARLKKYLIHEDLWTQLLLYSNGENGVLAKLH
jgi:hypothetical protein